MILLNKIVNQIYENIDYFRINVPIDLEEYKKFTELSVFVEYLNKIRDKLNNPHVEAINEFILSELNKVNSDIIFGNNYLPYHLVFPYFSIRRQFPIQRFERYLDIVAKYRLFPPEIPPHREMEWSHYCLKLNIIDRVKAPVNCILNQSNFLANFNRDLSYSFTHSLFYIYDFGFVSSRPLIPNFDSIKFQTECLIFKSYDENDIDILLELFINYFSFYRFNDINLELLDVLESSIVKHNFLNFNWKEDGTMDKIYHSSLVLGILCCLLIEMSDSKNLSLIKRTKLARRIRRSSVFGSIFENNLKNEADNFNVAVYKEYHAWQLIIKSTRKEFNVDDILEYLSKYKLCNDLSVQILNNLNLFKERNTLDILFESEYRHLQVSQFNQDALKEEYSVLMEGVLSNLQVHEWQSECHGNMRCIAD